MAMKTKAGIALVVFALSAVGAVLYAADASPLAGSWATAAVNDVEMPKSAGFLGKMAASAINGGNTQAGIGNTSGSTTLTGPSINSRTIKGGVRNGKEGEFEEPPIIMELKVDAKGKMTGSITEITVAPIFAKKELKVEEGMVTDKKFEFKTIEKSETASNTTRWVGELTDEKTITITRLTKGGNAIDGKEIVFNKAKK
jgi:hypothetical protein